MSIVTFGRPRLLRDIKLLLLAVLLLAVLHCGCAAIYEQGGAGRRMLRSGSTPGSPMGNCPPQTGVFINPALVEPFGLTIIEAAAYGLPVVATKNGLPVDILEVLSNGLLVDPHDAPAITGALLSLLAEKSRWSECRRNGLQNIHRFSWPPHCRLYLSHVAASCDHPQPHQLLRVPPTPTSSASTSAAAFATSSGSSEPLFYSLRDLSLRISVDTNLSVGDFAAAIMDALCWRRPSDRPATATANSPNSGGMGLGSRLAGVRGCSSLLSISMGRMGGWRLSR
uniref:sucrose-phosphate synthase n=1 Tax=Leersia perrieri TaxID=77586 RepID=A0A0D9XQM6_9ORYZ